MFMRENQNYKVSNQYNMRAKSPRNFKFLAIGDRELRKLITEPIVL